MRKNNRFWSIRCAPKADTWRGLVTNASARTDTVESNRFAEYVSTTRATFSLVGQKAAESNNSIVKQAKPPIGGPPATCCAVAPPATDHTEPKGSKPSFLTTSPGWGGLCIDIVSPQSSYRFCELSRSFTIRRCATVTPVALCLWPTLQNRVTYEELRRDSNGTEIPG